MASFARGSTAIRGKVILSRAKNAPLAMNRLVGCLAGSELKTVNLPVFLVRAAAAMFSVYYRLADKTPIITPETIDVVTSGVKISNQKAKSEIGFCPRLFEETMRDTV